jgi:hypothetical protein
VSAESNIPPFEIGTFLVDPPRFQGQCHSDSDGECDWPDCPQLRDGEPEKTGRSCPLYPWHHQED